MSDRPFVLSIAGFDPSAGAGVLADIKTLEQLRVYGLSTITANTIQTDNKFYTIQWVEVDFILQSMVTLFEEYKIEVVKIGIIPSVKELKTIIETVKKYSPQTKIVWDPVIKSSTGFSFLKENKLADFRDILSNLAVITPNLEELLELTGDDNPTEAAKELGEYCPVLLKGGHRNDKIGVDTLFLNDNIIEFEPTAIVKGEKHGTGCILSSAIAAHLALGCSLEDACMKAKKYIQKILQSNDSKLAYHVG